MYIRRRLDIVLPLAALALTACSTGRPAPTSKPAAELMGEMGPDGPLSTQDYAPLVGGFYEGGAVSFIHTEASHPDVANMLSAMMGPVVVLVPELAAAPEQLLANVFVFTSGVEGEGPFGFQADVFDSVPGDEAYRPLRAVNLVDWRDGATPREFRSLTELRSAEANGELTISQPRIVVNMPILVWPGGTR